MPKLINLALRPRRGLLIYGLALIALVAACSVGPGATTSPTSSPGPSSPPMPTPTPSPTPSPTFASDQISHPTGVTDVVLRMETGGGFVPMGFFVTQAPQFTLYGDGTVIFQQIDRRADPFDQAYLPWLVGHLDEPTVQALLLFALDTGHLATARDHYDDPMIADAGTTVFTINAGGVEKVVSVYALSEQAEPGRDAADRQAFAELAAVLGDFGAQQELGEVTEYDASSYRVIVVEAFGEPVGEPLEWPWDDLTRDDFPSGDEPGGQAVLDREHVAGLLDVPNGGHPGIWVADPDGKLIQLGVRPLLPDEAAAAAE